MNDQNCVLIFARALSGESRDVHQVCVYRWDLDCVTQTTNT